MFNFISIDYFFLFLVISPATPSANTITNEGIVFNFHQRVLLADKFINVQFIVPYPVIEIQLPENLTALAEKFHDSWKTRAGLCHDLAFPVLEQLDATDHLNFTWLVTKIIEEHGNALTDLHSIKKDMEKTLALHNYASSQSELSRQKRIAHLLLAGGAATVLGAGVGLGSKIGCAIKGIFGSCTEFSRSDKENIRKGIQRIREIQDGFQQLTITSNKKFFLVGKQLNSLNAVTKRLTELQKLNSQKVEAEFDSIKREMKGLTSCVRRLQLRGKENLQFSEILAWLLMLQTEIKNFRTATYTFRSTLLTAFMTMTNEFLPISLVPREHLEKVLVSVQRSLGNDDQMLSLAIPIIKNLTYYESKLLREVTINDLGLVFKMAIPLASRETVLEVYEAILLPMPQSESDDNLAIMTESKYIGISKDKSKIALLNDEHLNHCIGSSVYAICDQAFSMLKTRSSCLATLFVYHDSNTAFKYCGVDFQPLPVQEKAISIGYSRWLILAASSNYQLIKSNHSDSNPLNSIIFQGCKACIISLNCGEQVEGPNVLMRSDAKSCAEMPALRIDVKLPTAIDHLFKALPPLRNIVNYDNSKPAKEELVSNFRLEVMKNSDMPKIDIEVEQIAQPIITKLQQLKPIYEQQFAGTINWQMSVKIGIISFILNVLLHTAISHWVKLRAKVHRMHPFRAKKRWT